MVVAILILLVLGVLGLNKKLLNSIKTTDEVTDLVLKPPYFLPLILSRSVLSEG